jgi:hypothetical protein
VPERTEPYALVAQSARVRGSATAIFIKKVVDDLGLKLFANIDDGMWYPDLTGNGYRRLDIFATRATSILTHTQGKSESLVTFLFKEQGGKKNP